ncbi:MAG: tetratricopeptide repeat protein [Candidatus Omnitrophica bacterium]|nr:tetratricopeptide repeat protein [Candidatus Omnitrophota bacterium]MDD5137721.1 tetratricopeptide repeat protein [Candidatus Omnitrophota bacterium]
MRLLVLVSFFSFFAVCGPCSAETIIFKSGKVLEARIDAKTNEMVSVDLDGRPLYYETRLIETIDGKPPAEFQLQAVSISKDEVSGDFEEGLFLASQGKFQDAVRTFQANLEKNPGDANTVESLHILEDLRQEKISPEFAQALFEGTLLFLKMRYEAATKAFQRALDIKPDALELYYNLGNLYNARKLYREAIPFFEKLLKANPMDTEVLFSLGYSYFSAQEFQKAADLFERYLILDPHDPDAHGFLGACYYALGRENDGVEEFQKAQLYADEAAVASGERRPAGESSFMDEGIRQIINKF